MQQQLKSEFSHSVMTFNREKLIILVLILFKFCFTSKIFSIEASMITVFKLALILLLKAQHGKKILTHAEINILTSLFPEKY